MMCGGCGGCDRSVGWEVGKAQVGARGELESLKVRARVGARWEWIGGGAGAWGCDDDAIALMLLGCFGLAQMRPRFCC